MYASSTLGRSCYVLIAHDMYVRTMECFRYNVQYVTKCGPRAGMDINMYVKMRHTLSNEASLVWAILPWGLKLLSSQVLVLSSPQALGLSSFRPNSPSASRLLSTSTSQPFSFSPHVRLPIPIASRCNITKGCIVVASGSSLAVLIASSLCYSLPALGL